MSLAAMEAPKRGDVAHLQDLLHKREYHLAELIDEVVFAEQERYKAAKEAQCLRELTTRLEGVIDKLLQYHITLHSKVLLPALIGAPDARGVGASPAEGEAAGAFGGLGKDFLAELLAEPHLSSETKRLLQAVLREPRKGERRRPSPGSGEVEVAAVQHSTRRAIELGDSLLQNQEALAQLLHSIQDQAADLLHRWDDLGSGTAKLQGVREIDGGRRRSASEVAPFRLENLQQHSSRAREIEQALRSVEQERDALQAQLRERNAAAAAEAAHSAAAPDRSADEAWLREKVQLKQELAYAQQRVLTEQARSHDLRKQVAQLEKVAAASPIAAPAATRTSPAPCSRCAQTQAELKKKSADYHAAKAAWKAEEQRLNKELAALQSRTAPAATAAPPVHPAAPLSERKIGQLEATVAAMKADLQIMEMRMSIVQDEREAERRRILAAHARERDRLLHERDECQRIIDKMSRELQGLSRISTAAAPPAIANIAG